MELKERMYLGEREDEKKMKEMMKDRERRDVFW